MLPEDEKPCVPLPFECPFCHKQSWNPNDARQRYCGFCHVFVDDEIERLVQAKTRAARAAEGWDGSDKE
jgi:hypothetical protein